jgi:hypothetical protein
MPGAGRRSAGADGNSSRTLEGLEKHEDLISAEIVDTIQLEMRGVAGYGGKRAAEQPSSNVASIRACWPGCIGPANRPISTSWSLPDASGSARADVTPIGPFLRAYQLANQVRCKWIARGAQGHPDELLAALMLTSQSFEYTNLICATVAAAYLEEIRRLKLPLTGFGPTTGLAASALLIYVGLTPPLNILLEIAPSISRGSFRLSARETEVVYLVMRGLSNKKTRLPNRAAVAGAYAAKRSTDWRSIHRALNGFN